MRRYWRQTYANTLRAVIRLVGAQMEVLEAVKTVLVDTRPNTFLDCVAWARNLWQDNYHNTITQLLFNFPADQVTSWGDRTCCTVNLALP